MKRLSILACALATLCVGCARMDHFLVYRVKTIPVEQETVILAGQFDGHGKKAIMIGLEYFANPVRKTIPFKRPGDDIYDKDRHFTWYRIRQPEPEPRRTIRFENQFGMHTVDIRDPSYLLVPAQKRSDLNSKFPKRLDHYKAYEIIAVETAPSLPRVDLIDQFGIRKLVPVGKPRFFCVPVTKIRGSQSHSIRNRTAHLVAYGITPKQHRERAKIKDQFLDVGISVERSEMLLLPTRKRAVVTHDD